MEHDTMPTEECVGISDKKATGTSTKKDVSRKVKNTSMRNRNKVSNNFD